jgi:hypothetical protein
MTKKTLIEFFLYWVRLPTAKGAIVARLVAIPGTAIDINNYQVARSYHSVGIVDTERIGIFAGNADELLASSAPPAFLHRYLFRWREPDGV